MDDGREQVILVDAADRPCGCAAKLGAHRLGLRHRALSVILRDRAGRLLLQQRHHRKYHSGGLWTNAVCSHPRPGEPVDRAALRRLWEEMGIRCRLAPLMTVAYRADVGNAMIEDEIVHVFAGIHEGAVRPDPSEADGYRWIEPEALRREIELLPDGFSVWFRKYVREFWPCLTTDPCWKKLAA